MQNQTSFHNLLKERYLDDMEIFAEVAEAFLQSGGSALAALGEALNSGDMDRVTAAAHKLKGMTACFHHADIVEALRTLEHAARHTRDVSGCMTFPEIEKSIADLNSELKNLCAKQRG